MKATSIQQGKTYEIAFGKHTSKVKVKQFDPKNGSWICETESGKSIPIKDHKRFLKEACRFTAVGATAPYNNPLPLVASPHEAIISGKRKSEAEGKCDATARCPPEIIPAFQDGYEPKNKKNKKAGNADSAQLIAAAREASIRASIAKKAAGYGFCTNKIAEAAAKDADIASDAMKAAGIIEKRGGHTNGMMSGLDAAHKVLQEQGRPMRAKEILKIATENQYCELHGLTPDATIAAAMETEIKRKGETARFAKFGKGLFIAR